MVAVHSAEMCLPRSSPEIRMAMRCAATVPVSPKAMMMPEMMIAPMNSTKAPPALAAAPSSMRPVSLRFGSRPRSTSLRLVDAASQKSYRRGPISGHSATDREGAGTLQVPLLSTAARLSTDSPMEVASR